jgi:hypothetical protein
MKSYRRFREHSWVLFLLVGAIAFFSVGCSSSTSESGSQVNPLGAYMTTSSTSGIPTSGTVQDVGQIDSPIISTPTDGSSSIDGHTDAPLLDNMHPGWQQSSCLTCHNDTSRIPDHNYTNSSMCYLCHGANGLPGFADKIPPVISGVVNNPTASTVAISWNTDEECLTRLVLRTVEGDRLEFPVSTTYSKSHRYDVTGLQSEKQYTYELICTDKSGNKTTSATFGILSFTTTAKVVTPTITSTGTDTSTEVYETFFSNVLVKTSGPYSVKFSLTVKTASDIDMYVFNKDGTRIDTENLTFSPQTSISNEYKTLQADREYSVQFEATDATGVKHLSKKYKFTTDAS